MINKGIHKNTDTPGRAFDQAERAAREGTGESLRAMSEREGGLLGFLQDTLVQSVKAAGVVSNEALKATRDVVKGTLDVAGDVGVCVFRTASTLAKVMIGGAFDAAGVVGNSAVNAAKGVLVGVIVGASEIAEASRSRTRRGDGDRTADFSPEQAEAIAERLMSEKQAPAGEEPSPSSAHPAEGEALGEQPRPWVVRGY